MTTPAADTAALVDEVASVPWYHTLELPGGVVTPGEYDLRPLRERLPLSSSLEGRRCLDVGTHDGFWAFEMERRGAAEVVALDLEDPARLDWPAPAPPLTGELRAAAADRHGAFAVAHRALGSRVERRDESVYDLDPAGAGRFDFAVIGTLLLHLRDPVGALAAIRGVLGGALLCNEAVSLTLSLTRPRTPAARMLRVPGAPFWWLPNVACVHRYLSAAGFRVLESGGPYLVRHGPGFDPAALSLRRVEGNGLARQLLLRRGSPHAWALAQPAA